MPSRSANDTTVGDGSSAAEALVAMPCTAFLELIARLFAWSPKAIFRIARFRRVVEAGCGAVGVDVVDVRGRAGAWSSASAMACAGRVSARLRDVRGVRGRAVAGQLRENFAPRAVARSHDSRTRMPAPSPSTILSRSRLNGRQARDGSSAGAAPATRIASQQRTMPGTIGASAPPAIATSARPARIISAASPIACADAARGGQGQDAGPRRP